MRADRCQYSPCRQKGIARLELDRSRESTRNPVNLEHFKRPTSTSAQKAFDAQQREVADPAVGPHGICFRDVRCEHTIGHACVALAMPTLHANAPNSSMQSLRGLQILDFSLRFLLCDFSAPSNFEEHFSSPDQNIAISTTPRSRYCQISKRSSRVSQQIVQHRSLEINSSHGYWTHHPPRYTRGHRFRVHTA